MPFCPVLCNLMRTAIALGTNQGDLLAQLQKARDLLQPFHEGALGDFLQSPVYKTSPVNCPAGSPDFYNAVLSLEWSGSARSLLNLNKDIEYPDPWGEGHSSQPHGSGYSSYGRL